MSSFKSVLVNELSNLTSMRKRRPGVTHNKEKLSFAARTNNSTFRAGIDGSSVGLAREFCGRVPDNPSKSALVKWSAVFDPAGCFDRAATQNNRLVLRCIFPTGRALFGVWRKEGRILVGPHVQYERSAEQEIMLLRPVHTIGV